MSIGARKQAERFSWKSAAKEYLDLYNKVLKTTVIS
jgi:glycosyltransferase involved in cell wall biosynthesis